MDATSIYQGIAATSTNTQYASLWKNVHLHTITDLSSSKSWSIVDKYFDYFDCSFLSKIILVVTYGQIDRHVDNQVMQHIHFFKNMAP